MTDPKTEDKKEKEQKKERQPASGEPRTIIRNANFVLYRIQADTSQMEIVQGSALVVLDEFRKMIEEDPKDKVNLVMKQEKILVPKIKERELRVTL